MPEIVFKIIFILAVVVLVINLLLMAVKIAIFTGKVIAQSTATVNFRANLWHIGIATALITLYLIW